MAAPPVLGLGGCIDFEIVWSSEMLERLVVEYGIEEHELSTSVPVTSERGLVVSLLAYLRDGVGGERFVASSDIVQRFAVRFDKRVSLGGTSVRAGLAMSRLGVRSVVHLVSMNDYFRQLLPAECGYISSANGDSVDPHLIVQYPAGASVRAGGLDLEAPRANRVIYVNDAPNRELVLSGELEKALGGASAFLISGMNSMQDERLVAERLATLRTMMAALPDSAFVYYEDAGFHRPALAAQVRSALVDLLDVYSMNEDELQAHLGRRVDLLDVDDVRDALDALRSLIPARTLVVHTSHWALALGDRAWSYERALDGAVTMASARYSFGDGFTKDQYDQVRAFPVNQAGEAFAEGIAAALGSQVCCLPAHRLDVARPTTIGLGDTFVGGFLAAMAREEAVA